MNDQSFLERGVMNNDLVLGTLGSETGFAAVAKTSLNYSGRQSTEGIVETTVEVMEKEDEIEDSDDASMSLYFQLASSLNVELVYVILKSITQFAYMHSDKKNQVSDNLCIDADSGDATLTLDRIKVKNSD